MNERKDDMNAVANREDQLVRETAQSDRASIRPEANIFETKDGYILEADLPGVSKDGLEITLEGNLLAIVGRRASEAPTANLLYRESREADFRRVFELDPSIDSGKISAKVEQGVLTLTLPKAEIIKPRKIAVGD